MQTALQASAGQQALQFRRGQRTRPGCCVCGRLATQSAARKSCRFPPRQQRRWAAFAPLATVPEPETEKERSPLDYPQEWITPQPSKRPEPIPEFEKLETPRIRPLPGDPEQPDEEELEEEEKKKRTQPDKEDEPEKDPEKPEPAKPPGEK